METEVFVYVNTSGESLSPGTAYPDQRLPKSVNYQHCVWKV